MWFNNCDNILPYFSILHYGSTKMLKATDKASIAHLMYIFFFLLHQCKNMLPVFFNKMKTEREKYEFPKHFNTKISWTRIIIMTSQLVHRSFPGGRSSQKSSSSIWAQMTLALIFYFEHNGIHTFISRTLVSILFVLLCIVLSFQTVFWQCLSWK